jgi:hypothetical protein
MTGLPGSGRQSRRDAASPVSNNSPPLVMTNGAMCNRRASCSSVSTESALAQVPSMAGRKALSWSTSTGSGSSTEKKREMRRRKPCCPQPPFEHGRT